MRTRRLAFLVLGLAVILGCKGKKTSTTDPAPDSGTPSGGAGKASGKGGRGSFTVGKATTYITGPVDSDGYVDYTAALNERLSTGVTAQNNANVLLWQALGTAPFGPTGVPAGFFEKLGMTAPPANGEYFIGLRKYSEQNAGAGSAAAALDTLSRLATRPWTSNEQPTITNWLKAKEKPLALVAEATKRTHYYSPLVPPRTDRGPTGLINSPLPGAQAARELATVLLARAMLYTGHGQPDPAWQDLLTCHRLGRLVGRGGTLVEGLVGMAIEQLACRAEVAFLDRTQPDAKRIEAYLKDLAALPPQADITEKVNTTERFSALDCFLLVDRGGLAALTSLGDRGGADVPNRVDEQMLNGIEWDLGLEMVNRWFDRLAAAMREKDRAKRSREFGQIENDIKALRLDATGQARVQQLINEGKNQAKAKGQAVGEILVSLLLPAAWKVQDAHDRAAQAFENVATAFALAWYQRENGRYPEQLDALSKYLGRTPIDLFSGSGLIYRPAPNGYLLYSVGVNGKDDGGRGNEDQPPGDDLVVRIPQPR